MKRSVVITTLLLLAALSDTHGVECDTNIEVTENRKGD
jgi:hypothetical protein